MTYVGTSARRLLILAVAMALGVTALALLPVTRADAAFPGANGWIVFTNSNDVYAMPSDGSAAPTNLSGSIGNALADPVFSPDGTQIALSRDVSGAANIWIADFDPSGPSLSAPATWTQVTNGGDDGEPAWSPDGTQIAFVRRIEFTLTGLATNTDATGITLEDSAAVTDFEDAGVDFGDAVENTTTGATGTVESVNNDEITLAAPGLQPVTIPPGWTANDGYEVDVAHRQIFVAPSNGSSPAGTILSTSGAQPAYDDNYPSWSPDGTKIAFATTRNGNTDVFLMNTSGGSLENLTGSVGNLATRPNWSPDGTKIAFNSPEGGGGSSIWVMNANGTGKSNLTVGDAATDEHAVWSPDGTQIAFRRNAGTTYVVPAAGGTATEINSGAPASHDEPDWQAALVGVADAYAVDEGGTLNVAAEGVLDNDSELVIGTRTAVLDTDVSNGTLTLNADGSFTYVHDDSETTSDSFTYHPLQNGVAGSVATVSITVNPVDEAPTADDDGPYGVVNAGTLTVPAAEGVLVGDVDPEGLVLTASLASDVDNGTLTLNADGSFTYVHDGSVTSTDSFTYKAVDPGANESNVATVSIEIGSAPPEATLNGPTVGAVGATSSFSVTIDQGAGTPTYAWTVDGAPAGSSATLDFDPTAGGVFTIGVTVTDAIGSDSDSASVTVISDVEDSIFIDDIVWLAESGITKGCNVEGTLFCPTNNVTRGQMAAFLVRALELTDDGGGNTFIDDDGSIFEEDIAKLAAAGITKGCNPGEGNTKFCPNDPVTRGQMAAFLVRAFGLTDDGGGNTFIDDDGSIFEEDIAKLAAAGITKGCNPGEGNTKFCPLDSVTRGQMAAFLKRAEIYLP